MLDWRQLALMPDAELAAIDIARVNLACAAGLPEEPTQEQAAECVDRLDHYARCAKHYTDRQKPEFGRHPNVYDHSEAIFRIVCMVRILQTQFNVVYHPRRKSVESPVETRDSFIHGTLLGPGGTCATLPVVYAAVGRRLGYPLKLVAAHGATANHLFVRWDEPNERFNVEVNDTGMNVHPDSYYRTGLYETTPEAETAGCFLQSMAPRKELANFLVQRAWQWYDLGKLRQAVDSWCWATAICPANRLILNTLRLKYNEWLRQLKPRKPTRFPTLSVKILERRYPPTIPIEMESDVIGTEMTENLLNDVEFDRNWWAPMRRGESVARTPVTGIVDSSRDGCTVSFRFEA